MGRGQEQTPGATPNRFVMQQVNNKNNIANKMLARELTEIDRKREHSISLIDRDRLDMHDFMKDVRRKDSDQLRENETLLGRDPKAKPLFQQRRQRRRRRHRDGSPQKEDGAKPKTAPFVEKLGALQISDQEPQRSKTARASRPTDDVRRSEPDPETRQVKSRAGLYKSGASVGFREAAGSRLSQSTLLSSVTSEPQLSAEEIKEIIAAKFGKKKEPEIKPLYGPVGEAARGEGGEAADNAALMREVLDQKDERPRRRRTPLDTRVKNFCTDLEAIKQQHDIDMAKPVSFDVVRRYTLITKGVKAALAMSSDGSDVEDRLDTIGEA